MTTKWKLMGVETSVMTLELDVKRIEEASNSDLVRYLEIADMEREIAHTKHMQDIEENIIHVIKLIKAQQAINDGRDSRNNGFICGVI